METCYLCGQTMVDRDEYLLNIANFPLLPKFKHNEHIIQNALYGKLKAGNILCETCGSKLADRIDTEFVSFFQSFTIPISHILGSKDHGNNLKRSLGGRVRMRDGATFEGVVFEGKVTPRIPFFNFNPDSNVVKIYANPKVMKDYEAHAIRQVIETGVDKDSLKIEQHTEINDYSEVAFSFSEGVKDFNLKFKLGLNKIATGFAIENGIDRNSLPCTLDTVNEEIIFSKNVVPFFPCGILDLMIEPFRIVLEKDFPTHTLMLFTDQSFPKTKLICYVDLFSTFQHYVVLNHDYEGEPINKTYYQTIIKQFIPEINIRGTRWKHLNILADSLGVDSNEMVGMSGEEMYAHLEKKYLQLKNSYTLEINDVVRHISSRISINMLLRKNKMSLAHLSELEKEILDATPDLDIDDMLCMHAELHRIEAESPELYFRKEYYTLNENRELVIRSTFAKMLALNSQGFEGFKSYGHAKFIQLRHFVALNEIPPK